MVNEIQTATGVSGLFGIVVTLFSIILAWSVMQEIKWDAVFRNPRSRKARLAQVMAAVIAGYLFAQFILDYWDWSAVLKDFVE